MENTIEKNDEQLVMLYKIYREQTDPSYEDKSGMFDAYEASFAKKLQEERESFNAIYKEYVENGYLFIIDESGNAVDHSEISGKIYLQITEKGLIYIETKYPFLNTIRKGDEQLVMIYKIYREQTDSSYAKKSGIFETYQTSLAEKINEEKESFDAIYGAYIENGFIVILDENGDVVGGGSKIGGNISINITDRGIAYIEAHYSFLK